VKEIVLKADCWSCARLGVEHGPRSIDCPSGDLHYCKRTNETKPKVVCRYWRPSQRWLDHQLWKAGQATANAPLQTAERSGASLQAEVRHD
jgi:hypothetical protein